MQLISTKYRGSFPATFNTINLVHIGSVAFLFPRDISDLLEIQSNLNRLVHGQGKDIDLIGM